MNGPLKIIIPTAGFATRMRPQTWSKPKPLVSVAGRTALDHLLASFHSLPEGLEREYVIIYSPGVGESQLPPYMQEQYPQYKVHYVLQAVMKGQADALWLARQHLSGPVLICFSDTLIQADFSFLGGSEAPAVAWVKPVPDPRRFGVAELDGQGWVQRLVEKPSAMENNRVVVGCYHLPEGRLLLTAIEEQFQRNISLKGEFFLTDALNIMIEQGLKMRTEVVETWLDTGTIEATLETNRLLLDRLGMDLPAPWDAAACQARGVKLIPPVAILPGAELSEAVIGPHASIGANCRITRARVANSILEAGVSVSDAALEGCFIGRMARIEGRSAEDPPLRLNIGDNSLVLLK